MENPPFRSMTAALALAALWPLGQSAYAATLQVPSQYSTLASALVAAQDGDEVVLAAQTYQTGIEATVSQDNLVIRGENGLAHLDADGLTLGNGKAILVVTGNNLTIEQIEFSGAAVPDENGAGIRHEGGLLTVRGCSFHDNENGILTSNQASGELVVEGSEFRHNGLGRAGYTHNIYVGHIARFVFRHSYSHHATHGHNIKSRAAENHILYSRIMDEADGNASYQIDLPNGGRSYLIGNLIHQGINAENSSMISYAAEGASNPLQQLYVSGNTLVNDRSIGTGLRIAGTPEAVIVNNIFDSLTTAVNGTATRYASNLETGAAGFVDRDGYDYHLTATSPAIDQAEDPGQYNGIDLTPTAMYVHPLNETARSAVDGPDIGAYEYGSQPDTGDDTPSDPGHTGSSHLPPVYSQLLLSTE